MKKGFTLIELIVVIVILGIIALITTASVTGLFKNSTESLYETQVEIIESAAKKWIIANNGYLPTDGSDYELTFEKIVADGFLDDKDVINPRDNKIINGYIKIYFDSSVNQYKARLIDIDNIELAKNEIIKISPVVTSGDGLYMDEEESGKYYFKGANPNNYLNVDGEIWRIVSLEKDGTIKIIKQSGLENSYPFDFDYKRNNKNGNTGCGNATACPIWAKNETTVLSNSSLKDELNDYYYQTLSSKLKKMIVTGKWCYKHINASGTSSLDFNEDDFINFCTTESVNSKIGLINVKEIVKASLGTCGYLKKCQNNYLNNETDFWTLNYSEDVLIMNSSGMIENKDASFHFEARPVVYLNGNFKIEGKGTKENPFKIK